MLSSPLPGLPVPKRSGRGHQQRLFREALARDGLKCHWCPTVCERIPSGWVGKPKPNHATLDHVIDLARGGADELENVVIACNACNQRRGRKGLQSGSAGLLTESELAALLS